MRPRYTGGMGRSRDFVAELRRWEDAGGVWRVIGGEGGTTTVALYRCDGEEIDRFGAADPQLEHFLAGRTSRKTGRVRIVIETRRDEPGRRVLGIGSVGHCRTAARESSRCRRSRCPLPRPSPLRAGLLAEGRPFSAHEVYEARWKAGPAAERSLWQGLAQLCVGITHAERGNRVGALRLIGRARQRLEAHAATDGSAYGLDLDHIIEWIQDREREPDGTSWLINSPL